MTNNAAAPATPFTFTDVVVHTMTTWGLFSVFAIVYGQIQTATRDDEFALAGTISLYAVAISFVLIWFGAPFAWLMGWLLRFAEPGWLHIVAFWILGAVTSVPAVWIGVAFTPYENTSQAIGWILIGAAACGVCTATGRAVALAASRRRERRARMPKPAAPAVR